MDKKGLPLPEINDDKHRHKQVGHKQSTCGP